MTFTPTPEQERALDAFKAGETNGRPLVIEAGAGTGKTSTLKLIANSTTRRGQYVAFNKAIVVEAGAKMPGTVRCSTAHALAYQAVGKNYGHRLRSSQRMRSFEVARILGLDPLVVSNQWGRKVLAPGYLAGVANRSIARFCQSADREPGAQHVPYIDGIDLPTPDGRRTYENNRTVAAVVADVLPAMWRDLSNPHGRLTFKHEHYLKLWQLSDPVINADFILFDEAQDASPVMQAVVLAQTDAQVVWVGDSQQQIYGWTGAINALAKVDNAERTFLSQSFRFGPEIAGVANLVLGRLDAELRLIGSPDVASVVAPVADPDAILTRTNAAAFEALFHRQRMGEAPHLVGGGNEVLAFAKAAGELMAGRRAYHPELACFDTWGEVQEYVAQDPLGGELRMMTTLVDTYGVESIVKALGRMPQEAYADVVISTAHKAKGREWDTVQLGPDFPPTKEGDDEPGEDELRLLYVAVTRARRELDITAVRTLNAEADGSGGH